MKPTHPQLLGDLLSTIKREQGLEPRLLERRAVALWPEVAASIGGPGLPLRAPAVDMAKGALLLRVTSAPQRQEIMMHSRALIDTINARLASDTLVVTEIRFVGG